MELRSRTEWNDGAWIKRISLRYGNRHAKEPREIFHKSTHGPLSERGDDLVGVGLIPAMARGETLSIDAPVSPRLLGHVPQIQEVLRAFGPHLGHNFNAIDIEAPASVPTLSGEGRGVACFFSGGLDSFFTALRHRSELDALIFVHGLDIDIRNAELRERTSQRIRQVGQELGLPLIEIETDIRSFSDRWLNWTLYNGSVLASIALSLQTLFRKVYIASGYSLVLLGLEGSHPMLDPLWSTEAVELVHDGAEFTRLDKAGFIAEFEVAQRNLRVCYFNRYGEYNCGRCRKCTFMQLVLAAVGALDRFRVFETPLTVDAVRELDLTDIEYQERAVACLRLLKARGDNPELVQAIHDAFHRWLQNMGKPKQRPPFDGDLFARIFPPVAVERKDTS